MRRRVAQVLRTTSFALGMGFLLALALDSFFDLRLFVPWPMDRGFLVVSAGAVWLGCNDAPAIDADQPATVGLSSHDPAWLFPKPAYDHHFNPGWEQWSVTIPLWLLAAICLAWPVTSFIVARRRHKRGFPIAAKTDGAISTTDS